MRGWRCRAPWSLLGGTWTAATALLNTATIEVLQYLMLGAGIAATVYASCRIVAASDGKRAGRRWCRSCC